MGITMPVDKHALHHLHPCSNSEFLRPYEQMILCAAVHNQRCRAGPHRLASSSFEHLPWKIVLEHAHIVK
ncbi:hypothetical protein IEO21_10726 [Rhodonia placenta]|uniref:Uncharacterized protein n=1 Tax=Rhodonia placenta TaxID=104341 RepID=A0A8H7NRY2_9APHY|nr:hypothetical protein IEO21_10726 [Postia placenta]